MRITHADVFELFLQACPQVDIIILKRIKTINVYIFSLSFLDDSMGRSIFHNPRKLEKKKSKI